MSNPLDTSPDTSSTIMQGLLIATGITIATSIAMAHTVRLTYKQLQASREAKKIIDNIFNSITEEDLRI